LIPTLSPNELTTSLRHKEFRPAIILRQFTLADALSKKNTPYKKAALDNRFSTGLAQLNKRFPPLTVLELRQTKNSIMLRTKTGVIFRVSKRWYKVSYKEFK